MLDTLKSRYNIEFPNITLSRLDTAKFAADVNKLAKLTRSTAVAAFCGDLDDYRLEIVYFLDQGIRTNFDTKILKFCISTTVADPSSMSCIINSVKTNASIAEPIIASYAKAAQAYDNKDLSNSQKMTKNFVRELLSQKESHHELKSFKLDPDGWQSALNFAAISKNLPYRESNSICKNSLQQAMNDYASLFKLNETTFNDQEFVDAILQSTNIADTNQIEQNVLNLENLAQIYMMRPIDGAISTIDNSAISNIIAKIDTFESKVIARNAAKDSSIISHLAYAQFWHKTSMADATYYDTAYWDSVRTGKYQLLEEFYFEIATRLDNDNRQNGFDNKLKAILDEQRLVTMLQNFLSEIPNGELKNRWEIYLNH